MVQSNLGNVQHWYKYKISITNQETQNKEKPVKVDNTDMEEALKVQLCTWVDADIIAIKNSYNCFTLLQAGNSK